MDTSKFEAAEIYLKEISSIPIELAIKDLNKQLENDRIVPGLKLVVTGGQAIQAYFPHSPPLRTHDYDLKLVATKTTPMTNVVKNRMKLLGRGITRHLEIVLNKYMSNLLPKVKRDIRNKYGLELLDKNGKVFKATTNLKNDQLNILTFKLRGDRKIRTNSMADVYVVDLEEIEHYKTFTGLKGSDPILSENSGNYYIPIQTINGIPYAGMGYIVWDTYRMVTESLERGLPKHPRYVEKRNAIIQALNNPQTRISCDAMKDFVSECEKEYKICNIKGKRYKTVNSVLSYAIREGLISSDPEFINKIRNNYNLDYICESVKRML